MELQEIKKEEIATLHFLPTDVIENKEEKIYRQIQLNNAMKLGNSEKHKCKIAFHSVEGDKYVETTIWSLTDKYVCLKGNIVLLIAAVFEVII